LLRYRESIVHRDNVDSIPPEHAFVTDPDGVQHLWVCSVADTIERPILPVQAGTQQLLIVRDGERLVACERTCPHEQADLALGHCRDGKLFCPRHFAWFDLGDGAISPGWPARALKLFPIVVRDGEVAVVLPRVCPPDGLAARDVATP
jgi:3-phenylpropionate/trans-cinnamate dioxygenase ferredoxin subunit